MTAPTTAPTTAQPVADHPAAAPIADAAPTTAGFSLALTEEQETVRDWVHGFAADVIRPAAAEWDAREETPWPILQEARKVGIYDLEFFATAFRDPTGLTIPILMEELFWGDAGIGLSIVGTSLAAAPRWRTAPGSRWSSGCPRCTAWATRSGSARSV